MHVLAFNWATMELFCNYMCEHPLQKVWVAAKLHSDADLLKVLSTVQNEPNAQLLL